jgi:hypothetical protein
VTHERRLLEVVDCRTLESPADAGSFLPAAISEPFGTADIARAIKRPRRLAQQMAYCLRKMGVITQVGKQGNAVLYARVP